MKLRDILLNVNKIIQFEEEYPLEIIVRTNSPFDGEDMLFGFCSWDGYDLISEDGDSYDLDDEVVKYELHADFSKENPYYLIYWFKSEWTTGEKSNE